MNKKTRFKLILFLIIASVILFIIGISLALIFIPGVREASLGEKECKYVSNPYFATISCKPGDAGTNIGEKDILQEGQWLDRPKDVAQYTIYLKGGRRVITGIIYFEYYICSSYNLGDCKIHKSIKLSQDSEQITLPDLSGNDYIWIQFQKVTIFGTSGLSGAKYDISYIPFWIYHFKKAYRNLGNMVSPTKDMIQNTPWIINKFYFLFHSIPFILFFSLVVGLIFGLQMFFTVLLGWGIHVILDVFSHEGFWATKILYPFSNKSYDFLPWYNSKRFNVVNMALLFFGYLFVYFK